MDFVNRLNSRFSGGGDSRGSRPNYQIIEYYRLQIACIGTDDDDDLRKNDARLILYATEIVWEEDDQSQGGWVVTDPGGRSVLVYHPIGAPIPININTTITIPGL